MWAELDDGENEEIAPGLDFKRYEFWHKNGRHYCQGVLTGEGRVRIYVGTINQAKEICPEAVSRYKGKSKYFDRAASRVVA